MTHSATLAHAEPIDSVFDNPLRGAPRFASRTQLYVVPEGGSWSRMSNEDKRSRVIELNDRHLSTADIAAELETSEAAIRGIAHREKIRLAGAILIPVRRGPPMVMAEEVDPIAWAPLAGSVSASLAENDGCMWPVGEPGGRKQMFCGCGTGKGRYCDTHSKMARG